MRREEIDGLLMGGMPLQVIGRYHLGGMPHRNFLHARINNGAAEGIEINQSPRSITKI